MTSPTRNRLRFLTLTASALVLTGCAAGHTAVVNPEDSGSSSTSAITIATTSSATSLDFTTTGGAAIPAALMDNVYETLVTIDPESGNIIPHLASSWDVSGDATTYTFHLRDDVYFSNGDKFSAETAKFSIDYVLNEWSNGIASQMAPVKAAEVQDEHTLKVTLEQPSQSWLWNMSTAVGAMMSPGGIDKLATEPVGTGPYQLRQFSTGEFIALKPNPNYWGAPAASAVTISFYPDALSSLNALQAGQVDVVWSMQTPELLNTLPEEFDVEVGTTNGEILLSMNNNAAPFDDPRIRQAVAYGVDRAALNEVIWEGLAEDTGGQPVPPTDPWFSEKNFYEFDPARAQELMREAGAEGTKLTLTIPTVPYAQIASELLYSQLTEIGFDVTLESAEFPAVWLGQVMGAQDYQMSLISHVEPHDVPVLFGNPDYYLGYDSEATRVLLAAADTADSPERYHELMLEAISTIMDDAAALTLMNMPNIVISDPGISGLQVNAITDAMVLRNLKEDAQ
ncbi:ABC transporter substrate-binding protein [Corynebacterium stationis]|uniref:ABC transporter substrate-binding protein n=1 Tax=Corynebacterium stationis TaxID=1705 RepID=UPI002611B046|nr:ABC transporter substrate-binding protein [Corynebacterium stationis]